MQKYVQQVTKQVQQGSISDRKAAAMQEKTRTKKDAEKEKLAELQAIMKPVQDMPKVGKGRSSFITVPICFSVDVDPKSVVCAFFKQGLCTKGAKCKFSHDLAVERKTEKRNIYFDSREAEGELCIVVTV